MDELKDVRQKDSRFSGLFDHKAVRTNPFGENRSADRVYQRAERIAAAVYLITNHVPSQEPARVLVRESALGLLDSILSIKDEMRSTESVKLSTVRSFVRKLISLLRILVASGFVSPQNAEVTVEALDELGTLLTSSQRSALSEDISLSREDLVDIKISGQYIKDVRDKLNIKDMYVQKDNANPSFMTNNDAPATTSRGEQILAVLHSGAELGIRDIAAHLPEYGEKMIQRELARLVESGRIKKNGLKRWSRYSIATTP